jgi:two-component system chemotaxis sensor kinase CheA
MSSEFEEVWGLYADEGEQSLGAMEKALLLLKNTPTDTENIGSLFRSMHTFKGNSRVMGLSVVESRAHIAEDLIGLVRDQGVLLDSELIDLLLEMVDVLHTMLSHTCETQNDADPSSSNDLVDRMKNKFDRCNDDLSNKNISQIQRNKIEENADDDLADAIIFDSNEILINDPVYREIFLEIANDIFRDMRISLETIKMDDSKAKVDFLSSCHVLSHAVKQMKLTEWELVINFYLEQTTPNEDQAKNLYDYLWSLFEQEFGKQETHTSKAEDSSTSNLSSIGNPVLTFLENMKKPLEFLQNFENNGDIDQKNLIDAVTEIELLAKQGGFFNIKELTDKFLIVLQNKVSIDVVLHDFEFSLYEALIEIEETVLGEDSSSVIIYVKQLLENQCAKQVINHIQNIKDSLNSLNHNVDVNATCTTITKSIRKIHYACCYYKLDSAADLCTALNALFFRVIDQSIRHEDMLYIAELFVNDLQLVIENLESDIAPDMTLIEKLLNEATSSTTLTDDAISSRNIEDRLGLPQSLHQMLSPESINMTIEAFKKGDNFYIVRADLENDEELACLFLNWLESGEVKAITNVSVPEKNHSVFDFLLASPLNAEQINEVLINMDSTGGFLILERVLTDRQSNDIGHNQKEDLFAHDIDIFLGTPQGQQLSKNMLESIGELVTHQTMVQHLLNELVKNDLILAVESTMNRHQGKWVNAHEDIRHALFVWQEKIEKIVQIGMQTDVLLTKLQEEAISGRMHSVGKLLAPLVPFVDSLANKHNRLVNFSTKGNEIALDVTLLENLKTPLFSLVSFCAVQSIQSPESRVKNGKEKLGNISVVLIECEGHVQITIEDDGIGIDLDRITQRAKNLSWADQNPSLDMLFHKDFGIFSNDDINSAGLSFLDIKNYLNPLGGNLEVANLPLGGLRFTLTMSLTMLLLDGMVVRVDSVQYVIPIDRIQRIVRTENNALMQISADEGLYMLTLENDDIFPVQFLKGSHKEEMCLRNGSIHDDKHLFVIVIGKQQQCIAIKVNELIGQYNVLSRPLLGYLSHIHGVSGCTLLGNGEVGLVLDINSLFDEREV